MIVKVGDVLRARTDSFAPHCRIDLSYTVKKLHNPATNGRGSSYVYFDHCSYQKDCACLNGYWEVQNVNFDLIESIQDPITPEDIAKAVPLCPPEEVEKFFSR